LFVLCSDGLSGMVSDTEIAGLAVEEGDLDKLCERLIATANSNGGADNITVVCARLEPL
jgi:protein phosphatase